jgi:hypothetical protein
VEAVEIQEIQVVQVEELFKHLQVEALLEEVVIHLLQVQYKDLMVEMVD